MVRLRGNVFSVRQRVHNVIGQVLVNDNTSFIIVLNILIIYWKCDGASLDFTFK